MAWKKWSLAGGLGILAIWMAWWDKSHLILSEGRAITARSQGHRVYGAQGPMDLRRHGASASGTSAASGFGGWKASHTHRQVLVKPNAARLAVMAKIPKDACDIIILVEGMT